MVLDSVLKPKRFFDVKSKHDIAVFKKFVREHRWGNDGCPFYLEFPYLTIPDMIQDKIIHQTLGLKYSKYHHTGRGV
mgnify:CR=1 FL=1